MKNTSQVCVYVYEVDEDKRSITCKRGSHQYIKNELIYLLRIEQDENAHYMYIKNIVRWLNLQHQLKIIIKRFCYKSIKTNKDQLIFVQNQEPRVGFYTDLSS